MLHPRRERARIPRSEHELSAVLRHVALFTDVEGMLESALHHTFSSYVTSIERKPTRCRRTTYLECPDDILHDTVLEISSLLLTRRRPFHILFHVESAIESPVGVCVYRAFEACIFCKTEEKGEDRSVKNTFTKTQGRRKEEWKGLCVNVYKYTPL